MVYPSALASVTGPDATLGVYQRCEKASRTASGFRFTAVVWPSSGYSSDNPGPESPSQPWGALPPAFGQCPRFVAWPGASPFRRPAAEPSSIPAERPRLYSVCTPRWCRCAPTGADGAG
jgi:hypothetical protein